MCARGVRLGVVFGGPAFAALLTALWLYGGRPELWLVSAEQMVPYRWVFSAFTHVSAGHLAANVALWVPAAWFACRRVPASWLVTVALAGQLAGMSAHLAFDPRTGAGFAGSSPAVFAAATAVLFTGAVPGRARPGVYTVAVLVLLSQVAYLPQQLAGSGATSVISHLAGALIGFVAARWCAPAGPGGDSEDDAGDT